jgi:uncharacterized protein DUF4360
MRGKPLIIGAAVLALSGLVLVPPASATEVPPPADGVTIDVAALGGTGCPPDTTSVTIAPDNTTFSVHYTKFRAEIGVGAGPTDFRKNCTLNLAVRVPENYTFAIARSEFSGTASLAAGAIGTQRSHYYFSSGGPTPYITHTFTGPLDDNWQTVDEIDLAAMVFHPCGTQRNLNINTELRVRPGTSDPAITTSYLTMNSSTSSTYHFYWRHCY